MTHRALTLCAAIIAVFAPQIASAHCQIPCGIYDDERAFAQMKQDAATIARSVRGIAEATSTHDIARWTINKEAHAQNIQDAAQSYFLAQRVKVANTQNEGYEDYVTSATALHQIIVAAMKAKQSADASRVDALEAAIAAYESHYWDMHGHDHK